VGVLRGGWLATYGFCSFEKRKKKEGGLGIEDSRNIDKNADYTYCTTLPSSTCPQVDGSRHCWGG